MGRSIRETFELVRRDRRIALMPFIPAGYPDLQTTVACIEALQDAGADLIEVGFPFSDPIADGPTIQQAFTYSLARGVRVRDVIDAVAKIRSRVSIPLVAMLSYSIVFRFGVKKFVGELLDAGFAGLILPDLPPPEAQSVCETIRAGSIDTILLMAPTTPPSRRTQIAALCSGFIYYLSVAGVTGERDKLPDELASSLRELRATTDMPVCVGFGIHRREQVGQLAGVADGAIVGTAFVRRMAERLNDGPAAIADAVAAYCRELWT